MAHSLRGCELEIWRLVQGYRERQGWDWRWRRGERGEGGEGEGAIDVVEGCGC